MYSFGSYPFSHYKLRCAIRRNDIEKVKNLVRSAEDANVDYIHISRRFASPGSPCTRPLHTAVEFRRKEIAALLIEKGADVNGVGKMGRTPLQYAARLGHEDMASFLIEKGADVNGAYGFGMTPLHFAAVYGNTDIAALLIEKGADINAKNGYGSTPLALAVGRFYALEKILRDFVELFIENGADLNAKDKDGKTLLDNAMYQDVTITEFLRKNGAKTAAELKAEGK
jgi:ankyrin repeat protein